MECKCVTRNKWIIVVNHKFPDRNPSSPIVDYFQYVCVTRDIRCFFYHGEYNIYRIRTLTATPISSKCSNRFKFVIGSWQWSWLVLVIRLMLSYSDRLQTGEQAIWDYRWLGRQHQTYRKIRLIQTKTCILYLYKYTFYASSLCVCIYIL